MAFGGMLKDVVRVIKKGDEMDGWMQWDKGLCKGLDRMDERLKNMCWIMDGVLEDLCMTIWKG